MTPTIWPGNPHPLGATWDGKGTNFAIFSENAIAGMSGNADSMISDLHGTAAYRAHLVGVLTRRAVAACG